MQFYIDGCKAGNGVKKAIMEFEKINDSFIVSYNQNFVIFTRASFPKCDVARQI